MAMENMTSISPRRGISISFMVAAVVAFVAMQSPIAALGTFQVVVMATLVILLGLPHGALDVELAKKMDLIQSLKTTLFFLLGYLCLTFFGILLWIVQPIVALPLFLLISAYHFSDDWASIFPKWLALVVGASVICVPAIFHGETITQIFSWLLVPEYQASAIVLVMSYCGVIGSTVLVVGMLLYRRVSALYLLELPVLWGAALLLSPLVFFVAYFCFLHAPRHLLDCAQKLEITPLSCYVKSLPMFALTLLIAVPGFLLFQSGELSQDIIRWIFIGLFALTIPHIGIITTWYRSSDYRRQGSLR